MFEKVNPAHPDKVADRIAGAIVDLAYEEMDNPKVAVEVLIGHGNCKIITESNINFADEKHKNKVFDIVQRIVGYDGITRSVATEIMSVKQDTLLAKNQGSKLRCGDNGIFKGTHINKEEEILCDIADSLYNEFKSDGKYVIDLNTKTLIICQSSLGAEDRIKRVLDAGGWLSGGMDCEDLVFDKIVINPLGDWTGGIDVDTGATNRKLGSDMGRAITGGGLHGKDLSKADVSVNIVCYLLAQEYECEVEAFCAIGDKEVFFKINHPEAEIKKHYGYEFIVEEAREFVKQKGGFEKLAEWGLL